MNQTDPLANLRDIHLPADAAWWPLAPGWWILIGLLLIIICWSVFRWLKWRKEQILYHAVETELSQIETRYQEHKSDKRLVTEYSQLLKRLLIQHLGRPSVAKLTGQEWYQALNNYVPEQTIDQKSIQLLGDGKYQRHISLTDKNELTNWVVACARAITKNIIKGTVHA